MLLAIACLFATAAAGPVLYDQRQEGDFNAQVDISNLLFVFALPKKVPPSLFDLFSKNHKPLDGDHDIQERADVRVMEAFVEPSTPYRVEIGSERSESDGRAVEVVIAGRRRMENDLPESQEQDELKLLGATENCGPDRVRDSVTLMCKDIQPVETPGEASVETPGEAPVEEPVEAPVEVPTKSEPQTSQKDTEVDIQTTPEVVPS